MRILFAYQNTKSNNEDFALTPYIFVFCKTDETPYFFGFGVCWGHAAAGIMLGFGIPKNYPTFKNYTKRKP